MEHAWPSTILLVQSLPEDIEFAREAFHRAGLLNRFYWAESTETALDFLYQRGLFTDIPRPDLILLDPAVSDHNGWALFAEIKADPSLMQIPVIILTTTRSDAELLKRSGLNRYYMAKPIRWDNFINAILSTQTYALVREPSEYALNQKTGA